MDSDFIFFVIVTGLVLFGLYSVQAENREKHPSFYAMLATFFGFIAFTAFVLGFINMYF